MTDGVLIYKNVQKIKKREIKEKQTVNKDEKEKPRVTER